MTEQRLGSCFYPVTSKSHLSYAKGYGMSAHASSSSNCFPTRFLARPLFGSIPMHWKNFIDSLVIRP
jgi:hypothetical protein